MPKAGAVRELSYARVRVLTVNDAGMPERVRFDFPTSLDDPARLWLAWQGTQPSPIRMPAIGERMSLPALSLMQSMR